MEMSWILIPVQQFHCEGFTQMENEKNVQNAIIAITVANWTL